MRNIRKYQKTQFHAWNKTEVTAKPVYSTFSWRQGNETRERNKNCKHRKGRNKAFIICRKYDPIYLENSREFRGKLLTFVSEFIKIFGDKVSLQK